MRKILPILFLSSFISSAAYAGSPEETLALFNYCKFKSIPRMLTSQLKSRVEAPMTGANHELYGQLFRALDANDAATVGAMSTAIGLRACRFAGDFSDVIFFHSKAEGLAFLWRTGAMKVPGDSSTLNNPVDPLIMEVLDDNVFNMQRTVGKIFAASRARVLIINPVRRNWRTMVNYTMGESSLDSDATLAGLASHVELLKMYPNALYLLQYAMYDVGILVVNGFNSNFAEKCKSAPRFFMDVVPDYLLETQYTTMGFCKKNQIDGADECFKGSVLESDRKGNGKQCTAGSADKGRFMPMELGRNFRGPKAGLRIKSLTDAVNQTMENWVLVK